VNILSEHISPVFSLDKQFTGFEGWHKQAVQLAYCRILTIGQPKVGQEVPSEVLMEAEFDLKVFPIAVMESWVGLRQGEIMAFVSYEWGKEGCKVDRVR
jgi:hypothetical protein